jgi:hypothetical protein
MSCAQESFPGDPGTSLTPGPSDLTVGPLDFPGGKALATENPADFGGTLGSYKIGFVLTPGSTVTVMIAPQARGRVVIRPEGAVAVTYSSCRHPSGFFPQGFTFTGGRTRGCVPLDMRIGGEPGIRHVTISLFAGRCA